MEVHNLSFEQLKDIRDNKKYYRGNNNRIIPYLDGAIKIDNNLVNKILEMDSDEKKVKEYLKNNGTFLKPLKKLMRIK